MKHQGFYPNLTATENLEILASLRGIIKRNAVAESLERVGLPYKDKKLFSEFSLGMKQRLGIAAAIIHDPEILILDEPINGLDPIGVAETRNFLKELSQDYGKTILLSKPIFFQKLSCWLTVSGFYMVECCWKNALIKSSKKKMHNIFY